MVKRSERLVLTLFAPCAYQKKTAATLHVAKSPSAHNDATTRENTPASYRLVDSQTITVYDISKELLSAIHLFLTAKSYSIAAIDYLGVTTGPGSFTSIRTLLITSQALQFIYPRLTVYACSNFIPLALYVGLKITNSSTSTPQPPHPPVNTDINSELCVLTWEVNPQKYFIQLFEFTSYPNHNAAMPLEPPLIHTPYPPNNGGTNKTTPRALLPLTVKPTPLRPPCEVNKATFIPELTAYIEKAAPTATSALPSSSPPSLALPSSATVTIVYVEGRWSPPALSAEMSSTKKMAKNKGIPALLFKTLELPAVTEAEFQALMELLYLYEAAYQVFQLQTPPNMLQPTYLHKGYHTLMPSQALSAR